MNGKSIVLYDFRQSVVNVVLATAKEIELGIIEAYAYSMQHSL